MDIRVSCDALPKNVSRRRIVFASCIVFALIAAIFFGLGFRPAAAGSKTEERKVVAADLADPNAILLNAGRIDTTSEAALAMRRPVAAFGGKQMRLVKFRDAIEPSWYDSLLKTGVEVVDYIPSNSYLVYGDAQAMAKIDEFANQAGSPLVWHAEYTAAMRVDPAVARAFAANASTGKPTRLSVQLINDPAENATTRGLVKARRLDDSDDWNKRAHYVDFNVALSELSLEELAARPDVISVQAYVEPQLSDERQDMIVAGNITGSQPNTGDYLAWLASKGFSQAQFDASGFAVDISDDGLDNGTTTPNHFGLYTGGDVGGASRIVYNRYEGSASGAPRGCDGHGTLNSHIIGGFVPTGAPYNSFPFAGAGGFRYGLGVAPFVKIGSSAIFSGGFSINPDFEDLQSRAYRDGARLSSNSWGSSANSYGSNGQRYDALVRDAQPTGAAVSTPGNQEMTILFAAGNLGSAASTVAQPGTAKNVITIGATENVHPFGVTDGCGLPDSAADNINDLASYSGRGPTADGRRKPDLVAPGTHVTGGVYQASGQRSATPANPQGAADPCFTGGGVCGGSGTNKFFPVGQQWYTASTGTSHSTPAVAGGAALLRQYFINRGLPPPSPAMTKAALTNGARYLSGSGTGDNLYSNNQGMGLLSLDRAFDSVANAQVLRDQSDPDTFTATGQRRVFVLTADAAKPFRATLAWTDAPGSTTGAAWKNNLDLTLTVGGQTYYGNNFTGQFSTSGGAADPANNLESIYLPAGTSGQVILTVTAANINSDGVPNNAAPLDQDFALIVSGANPASAPYVVADGAALTGESFTPANSLADPGETVTVSLALKNISPAPTGNLTATLLPTGGVTFPSQPQNFGAVTSAAGSVTRPFTFVAATSCGNSLTLTFELTDGATSFGTYTVDFATGTDVSTNIFEENFDGVTAPAPPAGWSTERSAATHPLFATASPSFDLSANEAAVGSATTEGWSSLNAPALPAAGADLNYELSFDQIVNFETGVNCFDAGVVEVSLDNGAVYRNVTDPAIGGRFIAGGYTAFVATGRNPLTQMAAFCGVIPRIRSRLSLPAGLSGQSLKFRWRAGWDETIALAAPNWRIDNVRFDRHSNVCVGSPTTLTVSSSSSTAPFGQPVTFTATISPAPTGGTVDFTADGAMLAANVPVDAAGRATVTTSALAIGNHSIGASYSGTGSFGFSSASLAGGQTITCATAPSVTSVADAGSGSLREALASTCGGGTVNLTGLSGRITLTSGDLVINDNVVINGPGASQLSISGNNARRIFSSFNGATVAISGVTLENGNGNGAVTNGTGGAMLIFGGGVTLTDVVLAGNRASTVGGAIAAYSTLLTLNRVTVAGNTSPNTSGVYLADGTLNIGASTFSGNTGTTSADAIRVEALSAFASSLNIVNSTVSGNNSGGGSAGIALVPTSGGGSLTANLFNSTITANTTSNAGAPGGFRIASGAGTASATFRNSIVSGNLANGVPFDVVGNLQPSSSYNLIGIGGGLTNGVNGNLVGVTSPQLLPLANNGGPTKTHLPLPNSPVVDAGSAVTVPFLSGSGGESALPPLQSDQRGILRPIDLPAVANPAGGDGSDIGAVELQSVPTAASVSVAGRVADALGRGVPNAVVTLTDSFGQVLTARSNSFGYFVFNAVPTGANYLVGAAAKGRTFATQVVSVGDPVTDLVLVAQ